MNKVKNYIMAIIAILMAIWISSTLFYSIRDYNIYYQINNTENSKNDIDYNIYYRINNTEISENDIN